MLEAGPFFDLPPVPLPSSATPQPTWQELTKFIDDQNQKTRNTVDFWYGLATGIFRFIIIAAGFVGWRTVTDAKAAAVSLALESARTAGAKKLEEPEIQKLVHETVMHMLATGSSRRIFSK